jgi:hypothetical protein
VLAATCSIRGEVREKRLDLDRAEAGWGSTAVEPDEATDPMGVCVDSAWRAAEEGETLAENG